jgi:ribose transport system permease protein
MTDLSIGPAASRPTGRIAGLLKRSGADWRQYVIYIGFAAIFAIFAITLNDKGFLQSNNLLNIPRQAAVVAVAAVAMTFVIASAEIDLSVGSLVGLSGIAAAFGSNHGGLLVAVLAALGVGLLIGTINGLLVTIVEIPSFLVTLAMLWMIRGFGQWRTSAKGQPIASEAFKTIFGSNTMRIAWLVVFAVVGTIVLNKTRAGRFVLATGGNRTAAEFSGISTKRIKFWIFVASSVCASFAGMILAANLNNTGKYEYGQGLELSVIAAVILGGTSLFGGKGSVPGTIFGALFVQLIGNGLLLTGLESSQLDIIRGGIIIVAVALRRERKGVR